MRKLLLFLMLLFAVGVMAQSTVVVGGGGISNTATTNGIPRTDANGNLVASAITDNGTTVNSTRPVLVPDGTQANVGIGFASNAASGLFLRSSTALDVSINNTKSFEFQPTFVFLPSNSIPLCFGTNVDLCLNWGAAKTLKVGASGANDGFVKTSQTLQVVTSNYTTSATTLATAGVVTGLNFTAPTSLASNWSFNCTIMYSQATAAAANLWGVTTAGTAPTNLLVGGTVLTSNAGAQVNGNAIITTATSTTVVTATPSTFGAIGTSAAMFQATIWGTLEAPSNATPSQVGIAVATGNASDALTVYRGSSCWWY